MPLNVPNGVIVAWVGTVASIPANWSRETTLDGRYVKQIATSGTAPGATGGGTTHVHAFQQHSSHVYQGHNHSGSWGTTPVAAVSGGGVVSSGNNITNIIDHVHTTGSTAAADITVTANSAINTDTAPSDPLHVTVIFIKSNGSALGVPVNAVVWFNSAVPGGFSVYAALDNRLMKGAATGADGGTSAGTDPTSHTHTVATHTHPVNAHTHTVSINTDSNRLFTAVGGANPKTTNTHGHALGASTSAGAITSDATAENTGVADGSPLWQKMRAAQKTGVADLVIGLIAIWTGTLGTIPANWALCDGTAGTPNLSQNRFVRGAASDGEIGNTGGAATHTHAAGTAHTHGSTTTHSHTFTGTGGTASTVAGSAGSGVDSFCPNHSHQSATYTSTTVAIGTSTSQATTQSANSDNSPLFTGVAFIRLQVVDSDDMMTLHNIERGEKAIRAAGMGGHLEE